MESYHEVWLAGHPERSREWLAERLRDGFDVHHVDGDHANNAIENLVLIEHRDHMRLHGMTNGGRLRRVVGKRKQRAPMSPVRASMGKFVGGIWRPWPRKLRGS